MSLLSRFWPRAISFLIRVRKVFTESLSALAAITLGRQVAIAGTVAVVGGIGVKFMHH